MSDLDEIKRIAGEENVLCEEPLSKHTTFHIGGNAKIFVMPQYIEDLVALLDYVRRQNLRYFVMGNGSNLLAYDTGYDGIVITTHMAGKTVKEKADKTALDTLQILMPGDLNRKKVLTEEQTETEGKTIIFAGSGIMLSNMAAKAAKAGLTGFEFAGGIPGTLGGAVVMNAGAYGGEIKDCILGAMTLTKDGKTEYLAKEELELGYRSSRRQKEERIVLWALFAFAKGDTQKIEETMRDLNQRRREKQPLQYGSAGSTFKRPEGYFAAKLIEDAGLKGCARGGAQVSEKHAGFVVNKGDATAKDVCELTDYIKSEVMEKFGVGLELEVVKVGF